ncbi:spore photoproduct lyase family protein, partial [Streptomyces sp. TRM76130]|nr:spore photoproduct lyase family protein [Streptomyces sp. TRM76130]
MHPPSPAPDDDPGALFGLDALAAPARTGPSLRDSPTARRLLPVREIHAEPAAAASPRGRQIIAR